MSRLLSVVALATICSAVSAQEAASGDRAALFDKLDHDCDGYLSAQELELSADLKLELKPIDGDGDGRVSRAEFVAAFEEDPAKDGGVAGPAGRDSPR
ncbi:MAG: EF-hand domain-containing protein [Burkholderiales bacterium]